MTQSNVDVTLSDDEWKVLIYQYLSAYVDDCSLEILQEYIAMDKVMEGVFHCIRNASVVDVLQRAVDSQKEKESRDDATQ